MKKVETIKTLNSEAHALIALINNWYSAQNAPPREKQSIEQARELTRRLAQLRWRSGALEMASIEDIDLCTRSGPRRARVFRPMFETAQFTFVYVHGGGYVVGGIEDFDPECRRFANALGCNVIALSYRLAPEDPWPAGIEDVEDAIFEIYQNKIPNLKSAIILAGASAGAGISAAVCRRFLDAKITPIKLLVLLSPWLDMTLTQPSTSLYAEGFQLNLSMLQSFCRQYIPIEIANIHPELSAARNSVSKDWPETILFAAECDPLADDAALFSRRLSEAGVRHHLHFAKGMQHGCHGWWEHIPSLRSDLEWLDKTILQNALSN